MPTPGREVRYFSASSLLRCARDPSEYVPKSFFTRTKIAFTWEAFVRASPAGPRISANSSSLASATFFQVGSLLRNSRYALTYFVSGVWLERTMKISSARGFRLLKRRGLL